MNNLFCFRSITVLLTVILTVVTPRLLVAAEKKDARVTQVVRDVKLLSSRTAARPAAVNDKIQHGTAVHTGSDSRAELTFSDETLTRLGANTVFSFGPGGHDFDLNSGAILVAVPPNAGSAQVKTATVTAAVSGGVAMVEFHKKSWTKFIVIEGQGKVTFVGSHKTLTLLPGQIVTLPPGAKSFGQVHNIDLKKLTEKSLLIRTGKLPPWTKNLIQMQIEKQKSLAPEGGLADPSGFDAIDQRAAAETIPKPPKLKPPG